MVVLEQTPSKVYLVLPLPDPREGDELRDEALDAVAGGMFTPSLITVSPCST